MVPAQTLYWQQSNPTPMLPSPRFFVQINIKCSDSQLPMDGPIGPDRGRGCLCLASMESRIDGNRTARLPFQGHDSQADGYFRSEDMAVRPGDNFFNGVKRPYAFGSIDHSTQVSAPDFSRGQTPIPSSYFYSDRIPLYSKDSQAKFSHDLPFASRIIISTNDLEPEPLLRSQSLDAAKNRKENFVDLKSWLKDYLFNKHTFAKDKFETPWETFVFVELCLFMKIITQREIISQSFDICQVLTRQSCKVKKRLKMFQMIYCKVMKHLYKEFTLKVDNHPRAPNLLKLSTDFFEHYFGHLAKENGVSPNSFNHLKCAKNANLTYAFLASVFRSEKLRKAFLLHLEKQFMEDYQEERIRKVESMFRRWGSLLASERKSVSEALMTIRAEIRKQRFKFVLDNCTINAYLERFRKYISDSQGTAAQPRNPTDYCQQLPQEIHQEMFH
jgi:hypothetical protein